jgi:hypothetical protein
VLKAILEQELGFNREIRRGLSEYRRSPKVKVATFFHYLQWSWSLAKVFMVHAKLCFL